MSIDLTTLSPKALQKLISDATREQKRKKKRAPIAKVRAKLTKVAKAEGYTLSELFGNGGAASSAAPAKSRGRKTTRLGSAGRKVPAKYQNPDNPKETWTGRGRSPLWFAALIDAGKSRDDLLIRD
ncbi:MAG TPA: H-NS histone family protein [Chiayiivirga sp.]|nr:H-NS histone family protein [Chiayiivirga sp.]